MQIPAGSRVTVRAAANKDLTKWTSAAWSAITPWL